MNNETALTFGEKHLLEQLNNGEVILRQKGYAIWRYQSGAMLNHDLYKGLLSKGLVAFIPYNATRERLIAIPR